jgi:hypothetical protein
MRGRVGGIPWKGDKRASGSGVVRLVGSGYAHRGV